VNLNLSRTAYLEITNKHAGVLLCPARRLFELGRVGHPCGIHYVSKRQVVCSADSRGDCFICDQICKIEGADDSSIAFLKDWIFRISALTKLAFNVLVKGEERPRVFHAPKTVGEKIATSWQQVLETREDQCEPGAEVGRRRVTDFPGYRYQGCAGSHQALLIHPSSEPRCPP
jgi:hypothetical protein